MLERGASLLGIAALLGIGYAFSTSRKSIAWRIVVVGILLQVYLALFIVRDSWVPVLLTLAAGICVAILILNRLRGLPGYWAPASRGLGMLGAATTILHLAIHTQAWWALILLALLPAIWGRLPDAAGLSGNLAIIACVWWWGLPHDFVFRCVQGAGEGVTWLNGFAIRGADEVLRPLRWVTQKDGVVTFDPNNFVFAINVTAIILLYSALLSALYYVGALSWLVGILARVLRRAMGVTGAESLAVASNVFMGQTEAPLVIRPYLSRMTRSEITALMAGGFATIAGSVLGIYIQMLRDANFTRGAADLIAASVMSAPAAFVFAKLFVPETEAPEREEQLEFSREQVGVNFLDALARGVTAGLKLALNVIAMLLVFYALIHILNAAVDAASGWIWPGRRIDFQTLYSYAFAPFALLMGVPWHDSVRVGQLLGTKTIFNEFIAYRDLGSMIEQGVIGRRAAILATYALCGFANFMSIGIQIGGLAQLAPGRRTVFSRLALRAMIAGALACQLTACIVGVIGRF